MSEIKKADMLDALVNAVKNIDKRLKTLEQRFAPAWKEPAKRPSLLTSNDHIAPLTEVKELPSPWFDCRHIGKCTYPKCLTVSDDEYKVKRCK